MTSILRFEAIAVISAGPESCVMSMERLSYDNRTLWKIDQVTWMILLIEEEKYIASEAFDNRG